MRRLSLAILLAGAVATAGAAAHADSERDWMLHCQGCHGADGAGVGDVVPRLAGEVARFLTVPGGREFLQRVPGVAQSELTDERLARLLTWMVRRFGPAGPAERAAPFTADEVGRLRGSPLVDVAGTRAALVAAMEVDASASVR